MQSSVHGIEQMTARGRELRVFSQYLFHDFVAVIERLMRLWPAFSTE